MSNYHFESLTAMTKVDEVNGVINGVSVITVGEARGHGLKIDGTTLEQVKLCSEKYSGGLKVKLNHGSGVESICGTLRNFRIDGTKLVADLFLLKNHEDFAFLMELAKTIPDTFGISIAFSGLDESVGEYRFARCQEIYSADLVSEPAANPSGLFEVKQPEQQPKEDTMPEEKKDPASEMLSRLEALEKRFAEAFPPASEEKKEPEHQEPKEEMECGEDKKIEEMAARVAIKALSSCGVAPVAPTPAAEQKKEEAPKAKTFKELFDEKLKEFQNDKIKALSFCIKNNPNEYREALNRGDLQKL